MAPCTSTEFKCREQGNSVQARGPSGSGAPTKCISLDSVADGVNDCEDKSDEFGK